MEKTLLISRTLPLSVRADMVRYLTTGTDGNSTVFLPSNAAFRNTRIKGVIAMVLMQPEYVMQTGFDLPIVPLNTTNSVLA